MQPTLYQSYVLANYIGLFLLIMGALFLTRIDYYTTILRSVKWTPFAMLMTGFITLLIGIYLVQHHNLWVMRPRVLLTLISWIIFLKALAAILYPEQMIKWYYKLLTPQKIMLASVLYVILGVTLIFDGAHLLYMVKAGSGQ